MRLTEQEIDAIQGRDLLTPGECRRVIAYPGFKPVLPIYWALAEVSAQLNLLPDDAPPHARTRHGSSALVVRNELRYDEFLQVAIGFRAHCSAIVNLLKQPVPWAYFHLLNLMTFLSLVLVGYCLVFLASWIVTIAVHAVICLTAG